MNEAAIIKERCFITSPTRTFVMGLCEAGELEAARQHLAKRRKTLTDVDSLLECANLLAMVERYAKNFYESLRVHLESLPLERDCSFNILKARLHSGLGITCEEIARREGLPAYLSRALSEHTLASRHYQLAGEMEGAGDVENNVAMVLCDLGRTEEAREHLRTARAYFGECSVKLAQVDETEARVCLKEGNSSEALYLAAGAVRVFIRHSETRLRDEALRILQKAAGDVAAVKEGGGLWSISNTNG